MNKCKMCGTAIETNATYCKSTDCIRKRTLCRVHKYRESPSNREKERIRARANRKPRNTMIQRRENRAYYHKNKQKRFVINARYRANKRGLPKGFTIEQWQYAINYFSGCCAMCGRQLNDLFGTHKAAMDHWIPIAYEGNDNPGTVAANIVPLCHGAGGCNNSKNATMPDVWLRQHYTEKQARQIEKRIEEYFEHVKELEE